MVPDHSRSADQLVNNIYIQYENLITSVKRNRKPIFCTEAMLYNNHCNKSYKRVEVDVSTPFLVKKKGIFCLYFNHTKDRQCTCTLADINFYDSELLIPLIILMITGCGLFAKEKTANFSYILR